MSNWYYYDKNGVKFGMIKDAALKQLALNGIITSETTVETETGQQVKAGQIKGLFSSVPVPPPPIPTQSIPKIQVPVQQHQTGYFSTFGKYTIFNGRAGRKEYWKFTLINLFVVFILFPLVMGVVYGFADGFTQKEESAITAVGLVVIVWGIFDLIILLPSIGVTIRRLHDTGRSGWWWLIFLIPYLGWLVAFVWLAQDSQAGTNQYGLDPKGRTAEPMQSISVLDELKNLDIQKEIIPVDGDNVVWLVKNSAFWLTVIIGSIPLFVISVNHTDLRLAGMLFFFAMIWGGIFYKLILKSNEKLALPLGAFFFTGIIGLNVLLIVYECMPPFYLNLPNSENPLTSLLGYIFQTGFSEETCKIVPVFLYVMFKGKNARPGMILLVGVFSGLGFAVFENFDYITHRFIGGFLGNVQRSVQHLGEAGFIEGLESGIQGAAVSSMLRAVSCAFGHAMYSAIFACFVAMATMTSRNWLVLIGIGLLVSSVVHGFYDWFCGIQPTFAAITTVIGTVLLFGYLERLQTLMKPVTEHSET